MNPWNACDPKAFLMLSYRWLYRDTDPEQCLMSREPAIESLQDLYSIGKNLGLVDVDFQQFVLIMLNRHPMYRSGHYWGRYVPFWRPWTIDTYRVSRRYRHNPSHTPKAPKDKRRNKNKKRPRRPWMHGLKKSAASKHRALERMALAHEDYDTLHRWTYKHAVDPWSWD